MEGTIGVKQIVLMLFKHIKLILLAAIIGGVIAYFYSVQFVEPIYASSGTMYVQNKITTTQTTSSGDLSAAARLASACSHIFTTQKVLEPISNELKEEYGLNFSTGTLKSMISVSAVENSELLKISVKGSDPVQVYRVCSMVINVAPDSYKELINAGTMVIVDEPKINYSKTNSDETTAVTRGIIIGAVIAIALSFIAEFMNKQVKPDDDLYELYGIPVFAEILDFNYSSNSKRYGRYGRYGRYAYSRYGYNYNSYRRATETAKKQANKEYETSIKKEEAQKEKSNKGGEQNGKEE